ncbi:hypothetical protein CLU79DRAFT_837752 [Phycomyces nitens]|nr:hypothetical protein CLU79DRAFT_837752 [Phycomyces nitens]
MADTDEFSNVQWNVQGTEDMNHNHSFYNSQSSLEQHQQASLILDNPSSDNLQNSLGSHGSDGFNTFHHSSEINIATLEPSSVNVDIDISDDPLLDPQSSQIHSLQTPTQSLPEYFNQPSQTTPQPVQTTNTKDTYSRKHIFVTDPRKETDPQQGTFVSYGITSDKPLVRRRFQDFVWLRKVLYADYPACFVPPLPDKHRMEYVKGDRFGTEFIEKRRMSLQRFLQRISWHPVLGRSNFFVMFLESSDFNDASARALRESQETMIDTLGDSLLNAFSKLRKPDERFVEMKERIERTEENLELLEKTLMRSNKRTDDLCSDYEEFSASIRGLAELEANMNKTLLRFAAGVSQYAKNIKTMASKDTDWLGEIHDYMAYYSVLKDVLKLRDQKQLDVEELTDYYQTTMKEKEKIMRGRPGEGYNFAGYFTGKINEVRGADTDKIKREKILRLDERLRELKNAKDQSDIVSCAFSDQVKKEDHFFTQSKSVEMNEALKVYTDGKVEFYDQGIQIWRDVVQALEEVDPDES